MGRPLLHRSGLSGALRRGVSDQEKLSVGGRASNDEWSLGWQKEWKQGALSR